MKSDFERTNRPADLEGEEAHEFDLFALSGKLLRGEATRKTGKTAMTLARDDRMTVVLTVLKEGAELQSHKAESPVTVSVLSGRMVFRVGSEEKKVVLGTGSALVMSKGLPHSARASSDSSFLLVIGGKGA